MHVLPSMEYFSQPPVAVLPVLLHIGTVTAEASWTRDHVTVYETFHPSVCYVVLELPIHEVKEEHVLTYAGFL
jgi:hypothetical protein